MYNVQAITTALRGLVGFRAHQDENLTELEADLTSSRSGLWLDKAHALITAQILTGAAVVLTPTETGDPLSILLRNTLDDSVAAVLSALRTRKLLRIEANTFISATPLYEGEGSLSDLIQPANRFVGLRLTSNDPELAITINRLATQFTGPAPGLKIYVAVDRGDLDEAMTISPTSLGRMQWVDTPIILTGGFSYLIGYYEADLPSGVQAVRRNKVIGAIPCASCSPQNNALYHRWGPYLHVEGIRIDAGSTTVDVIENQNYGLNLAVSVGCDIGPILMAQQTNMAEAIRQQAVVKLLSEIAYSPLITTIEQQVRQNAMFALKNGEETKLERLLDALDIDFSGLSARCLPATNSGNLVKRTTVFRR